MALGDDGTLTRISLYVRTNFALWILRISLPIKEQSEEERMDLGRDINMM